MKKIFFIAVIAITSFGCSKTPITGRRQFTPIPASQILALSQQDYRMMMSQSQMANNTAQGQQLQQIGVRMARAVEQHLEEIGYGDRNNGFAWEFNLINSDQVNAFCMPGGKIAFYTGILPICQNEDGIAAVMGHEIGHAVGQHSNERMGKILAVQFGGMALSQALSQKPQMMQQLAMAAFGLGAQVGYVLPFSRNMEEEADEYGLHFMALSGYNLDEAVRLWQRMDQASSGQRPPQILSTHPDPKKRAAKIAKMIPAIRAEHNVTSSLK